MRNKAGFRGATDQVQSGRLLVKVVPGSSRNGIAGFMGDALRIRVRAPAEGGKANRAAERLVAEALKLRSGSVEVVSGRSSSRKTMVIRGLDDSEIRRRLSAALEILSRRDSKD